MCFGGGGDEMFHCNIQSGLLSGVHIDFAGDEFGSSGKLLRPSANEVRLVASL